MPDVYVAFKCVGTRKSGAAVYFVMLPFNIQTNLCNKFVLNILTIQFCGIYISFSSMDGLDSRSLTFQLD